MRKLPFHVYAEDGFEEACATERTARAAAKRGSKNRRVDYRVIVVGPSGYTGGGHGRVVAEYHHGKEVKPKGSA